MAIIIYNQPLKDDLFLMKIKGEFKGKMGQFYMVKIRGLDPLLPRPISIYDIDEEGISFLYRKIGRGTGEMSYLREGDLIDLEGPYGNGFPEVEGKIALVGGGIGTAPFYLTYKYLTKKGCSCDLFCGFRKHNDAENLFKQLDGNCKISVDGFITDLVNPEEYDFVFSCGPEIMMKVLDEKCKKTSTIHYVSMEKRMACGVGACLVCTCKTSKGNKRTCKDGPVFLAEEVFYE